MGSGAKCAGLTKLFFDAGTDEGDPDGSKLEFAKAVCRSGCPLRQECYWGAVERHEPAGVWGGVLFPGAWKRGMAKLRREVVGLAAVGADDDVLDVLPPTG